MSKIELPRVNWEKWENDETRVSIANSLLRILKPNPHIAKFALGYEGDRYSVYFYGVDGYENSFFQIRNPLAPFGEIPHNRVTIQLGKSEDFARNNLDFWLYKDEWICGEVPDSALVGSILYMGYIGFPVDLYWKKFAETRSAHEVSVLLSELEFDLPIPDFH